MDETPDSLPPAISEKIRSSFAAQSLMTTLGARIARLAPGTCRIEAPILPGSRQQMGFAHAGLTFSIGDSAAGYAALTLMDPEDEVVTAEMKINLLAPADGELLVAEGRVVRPGRRIVVVTADVHAETGAVRRHVALLQGTMMPIRP